MACASNWLTVDTDEPVALDAPACCLTACDIKGDNYWRLVAADIGYPEHQEVQEAQEDQQEETPAPIRARLKLFRGPDLSEELELPGIPAAVESLYIDESEPKTTILAVAIAESVLFFRHLKPYFKYSVPELAADELERETWRKLPSARVETQGLLVENLRTIDRQRLSRMSQRLLQLTTPEERDAFIREHAEAPVARQPSIVAMRRMQRVSCDAQPPSNLVLATEVGDILILEPQSFGVLYAAKTCAYETTPSLIAVHGTYETDFRIVVATRYGHLYLLRKATHEGQEVIKLPHPAAGLALLPIDQTIVACSMDHRLACYSKKGKQLYVVTLAARPVCMATLCLPHLGLTLVAVALQGGLVQFYMQRHLVDEFQMEATVTALLFGRLGYEDNALTLVTERGHMVIKILCRVATFEPQPTARRSRADPATTASAVALFDKPKKSSIFIEQSAREKANAKATYGSFQVELWRLRHTAARATVEAINSSESTISGDITHAPVKLSAEVCGAGPGFRLYLTLQNLSAYKMASNLSVLLHADRRHYHIPKTMAMMPSILPGVPVKVDFEVNAILDPNDKLPPPTLTPENAIVRVMLLKANHSKPLIAAVIPMPQSEANF